MPQKSNKPHTVLFRTFNALLFNFATLSLRPLGRMAQLSIFVSAVHIIWKTTLLRYE